MYFSSKYTIWYFFFFSTGAFSAEFVLSAVMTQTLQHESVFKKKKSSHNL